MKTLVKVLGILALLWALYTFATGGGSFFTVGVGVIGLALALIS